MFSARDGDDDVILLYALSLSLSHKLIPSFESFKIFAHTDMHRLDQTDFHAIVEPTIMEEFITTNGRQLRHPLETLLDGYIDIIGHGKVRPVSDNHHWDSPLDKRKPWVFYDYTEVTIQRTVTAFNELVNAIDSLLPDSSLQDSTTEGSPLVTEAVLSEANIHGFAKAFRFQAKKPRFKYIAPGITVPTAAQILNQPYKDITPPKHNCRAPILIFQGDEMVRDVGASFGPP